MSRKEILKAMLNKNISVTRSLNILFNKTKFTQCFNKQLWN